MGSLGPFGHKFLHKQLGELVGCKRGPDIVQFRGIPYATIPGRFRQSVSSTHLTNQPFDARNPGGICPQKGQGYYPYWEADLLEELPVLSIPAFDEFNCLNLSITVSERALSDQSNKIPVYVFIHGGGLTSGSHAAQLQGREVFDAAGIVRHSISMGREIMVVAINYRVGPLGFIASKELVAYNQTYDEPVGNYGFHDQRRALDWVSTFIFNFGGDPSRVTIQGTSAGSLSCHYHCLFPDRKFQRAILASGTFDTIGPKTLEQWQPDFDGLADAMNPDSPPDSRLKTLLSCPAREMFEKAPDRLGCPSVDGQYILDNTLRGTISSGSLPEIMLGAMAAEDDLGPAFLQEIAGEGPEPDKRILKELKKLWGSAMMNNAENFPFQHADVLDAYGLQSSLKSPTRNMQAWGLLIAHFLFNISTLHTTRVHLQLSSKCRIWLFHYAVTCPYPASHSPGKAHHGVNDLVLFNIAPDQVPKQLRNGWDQAVEQTQKAWIEFANGGSPWEPLRPGTAEKEIGEFGPVFVFADGEESRSFDYLHEALDKTSMQRWEAVLKYCDK